MHLLEFSARIFTALLCGLAIGFERQFHHKNAGIRTNGLVALGAAIYVLLSFEITQSSGGDVTRIVGQVVTGIGFLCAGVIFHQGINVQGLTTAATVWCSSAIGCMAAAGFYAESFLCTAIVISVNAILKIADDWVDRKNQDKDNKDLS